MEVGGFLHKSPPDGCLDLHQRARRGSGGLRRPSRQLAMTEIGKLLQLILEKNSLIWINLLRLAAMWQSSLLAISRAV
jgi:hypothetical protein